MGASGTVEPIGVFLWAVSRDDEKAGFDGSWARKIVDTPVSVAPIDCADQAYRHKETLRE